MTPEKWEIISRIFNEATSLNGDERRRFISEACGGDTALRLEIESLLSAHERAGDFIRDPIVENLVGEISEMPTLTGKFVGHYRIEKSIGRGGMGDVYLATDTRLERLVALKRLPERLVADPLFVKRFHTEARTAATLHHPNVATLFSVEEIDDRPFITMEYIDGRTLEAVTPPEGMEISRFLDIFKQLADALTHAHQKGVVHRDIKPGNIMIASDGTPKILDFGLAQFAEDANVAGNRATTITQPGQILGTPSYMSPEQAQGKDVDHRTDIFSLGVVMYEALTGRRPFSGDNNAQLISDLLRSEPAPVTELRPEAPTVISRLVEHCMQKQPSERPQEMRDVRSLLVEAEKAIRAETSTGSFARRLYRESRSAGVWVRLVAGLLVIALATAAWIYFSRERRPPISFENMAMRRLTDTNNVGFAQISPDGGSIAYATFESDGDRVLWIRRIGDRNALQLTKPERQQFWGGIAISPDGGQVFYITADRSENQGTLYRVSSLGGPSRKIVDVANDVGGVSSDGERILVVRYGEPNQVISVRTSDGSDEQVVVSGETESQTKTNFRDPQYSSDGQAVYYVKYAITEGVEEWSIEESSLVDGTRRMLYRQPERISELAVLPESRGLLVTAVDPVSNLQQIFHVATSDGTKTRVTNDLFFYYGVSVDREGKYVVASQRSDQQKIWVGDADDLSGLKPVNQEPNANRRVNWTPDGRLVYDGYENNVSHIWISDAEGRDLQKLSTTESDDYDPRVSADGRYIVFISRRTGRPEVWRMNIDGSDQVLLADLNGITVSPTFAADGQTVVFEWLAEGDRKLMSIPVTGGPATQVRRLDDIPQNYLFYWAASPDGRYIAQSVWDKSESRMKVSVVPQRPQALPKLFDIWPSLIFKWTLDSKRIIYREKQVGFEPESNVLEANIESGKVATMLSTSPEYVVDISFSRDGQKVAVVRGKNTSNAVMLSPSAGR